MARPRWPSWRAAREVIQRLSPDASAVRPSRLAATFTSHIRHAGAAAAQVTGLSASASRGHEPAFHDEGHARATGPHPALRLRVWDIQRVHDARHARPRSTPDCRAACVRNDCRVRALHRPWLRAQRRPQSTAHGTSRKRPARTLMPAPGDDDSILHQDAADARVGIGGVLAIACQLEGTASSPVDLRRSSCRPAS